MEMPGGCTPVGWAWPAQRAQQMHSGTLYDVLLGNRGSAAATLLGTLDQPRSMLSSALRLNTFPSCSYPTPPCPPGRSASCYASRGLLSQCARTLCSSLTCCSHRCDPSHVAAWSRSLVRLRALHLCTHAAHSTVTLWVGQQQKCSSAYSCPSVVFATEAPWSSVARFLLTEGCAVCRRQGL